MQRSPLALVLAAALGVGASLQVAPALAQQGASTTVMPIRTGASSIGGTFGVRLAVYDRQSFEISWNRVPNAASYRVQVGDRTVQENGALSRYVSGVNLSGGFDYTLTALDRAGAALAVQRFRVQPASGTQLVALGGTGAPTTPTVPATPTAPTSPAAPTTQTTGPIRTGTSDIGGDFPVRLAVYDARSFELFWERVPNAVRYRLSRGGQVVQESDGLSRYVAGIDGSASFAYTLVALDRSGTALRSTSFTVAPRGAAQLVAGGGTGTPTGPATPATPATPTTGGPIRTGQTTLAGDISVRLAVYDARSYELFWARVPGAVRYRLSRDGAVVQESDAVSRFVAGADLTRRFGYALAALDRSGAALRTVRFTVAPRDAPQLVATGGGANIPTTPTTPTAPGGTGDSPFLPAALAAPLLASIEPGSPLSVANHETFVRAFYDIAEPRVLGSLLRRTERLQAELRDAVAGADSRFVAESTTAAGGTVFACPDGGTVEVAFEGAGTSAPRSTLDFRRCTIGDDTLSGITREGLPDGRSVGTDRTFGGYGFPVLLYPFNGEADGLGAEGERFTVETATGLTTTIFGRVRRFSGDIGGGVTFTSLNWRGNWRLARPGASLLVTNLYADSVRYSEGSDEGDRVKPYFVARGTVTNDREIEAINQSDFADFRRAGFGLSGDQVFRDAAGGIMNVIAGPDSETGEQRTRVRIDTDGVILNRALPAELAAERYLTGR